MEERSCLGCGCGCAGIVILLTIMILLVFCGLIIWAIFGVANVQNPPESGVQLLTVCLPFV